MERAQLTSRLLSVQPSLSDYEFAIFWALSALAMHRAEQAEIDPSQHVRQLHANSREFFDSFCQSFLRNVLGSDLVLTPDSPKILALMTEFLDNIPPDRAREIAEICSALARNASMLSGATLAVLYAGLKTEEATAALKHAEMKLRSRSDLNQFEMAIALEWIVGIGPVNWSIPASNAAP